MSNNTFKTILIIVLIAIAGLLILNFSMKNDKQPIDNNPIATTTNNGGTSTTTPSLKPFAQKCGFKITSIRPDQVIDLPTILSGVVDRNESAKAGCSWSVFEGVVGQVQIFANVNDAGLVPVSEKFRIDATSDWMATTTYFHVTINLKSGQTLPYGTSLVLKFEDDSPRGVEFIKTMEMSLIYGQIAEGTQGKTMQTSAYFHDESQIDTDCGASMKMTRTVPYTTRVADASLRLLFREDMTELQSFYNGVTINDKVARVDFDSGALKYLDSAACMQASYKGPIEATLRQYPTINRVEYSIDGKVKTDWDA